VPLPPSLSRALGCATVLSASVVGAALADPADPERTPATGPVIDQQRLPSILAPAAPEKPAPALQPRAIGAAPRSRRLPCSSLATRTAGAGRPPPPGSIAPA
jgi:hypothetical protein